METATTSWTCDTCGEEVTRAEDGWVEWIEYADATAGRGRDLRLVHHLPASPKRQHPGCQFNQRLEHERDGGIVHDLPLTSFLGPDGLMRLLVLMSEERLPSGLIVEMTKRLHISGYEAARPHFSDAIHAGVFEPNLPKGFYWQGQIEATLRFVKEQGR